MVGECSCILLSQTLKNFCKIVKQCQFSYDINFALENIFIIHKNMVFILTYNEFVNIKQN